MGDGAFLSRMIITGLDRLEQVTDMPKIDTSEKELVLSDFDIELQNVSFAYDSRQIIKTYLSKCHRGLYAPSLVHPVLGKQLSAI